MKPQKSEAIVLHTFPSRERDKLVVFMTPELGKLRGWAYGARSMRTRYGSALEPLSKVRVTFLEKEGDETVRLDSIELLRSMFPAQQQLASSIAATYLAENIDVFAQANEAAPLLYRLLDRCCEALLEGSPASYVVAYFEVWILKLTGVFPSMQNCIDCGSELELPLRFEESRAGFVCDACDLRAETVPNDVSYALQSIVRLPVADFAARPLAPETLLELRRLTRHTRRHFLGHELKSYDILQGTL